MTMNPKILRSLWVSAKKYPRLRMRETLGYNVIREFSAF